jgi:hypothetical protein
MPRHGYDIAAELRPDRPLVQGERRPAHGPTVVPV